MRGTQNVQHHCYDVAKIESALSTAFYSGVYPFVHGGVVSIAAAMCFYLVKAHAFIDGNKRAATLTALTFLDLNGYELVYPDDKAKNINALADIIESCAASKISIDELKEWFEIHKRKRCP